MNTVLDAAYLLCAASVLLSSAAGSPQRTRFQNVPGSSNSFTYSTQQYSTYNSFGSPMQFGSSGNVPVKFTNSQTFDDNNKPPIEFLSPKGIRITIAGPHPRSTTTTLNFYVNKNRDFNGVKQGQYEAQVNVSPGGSWTYAFPNIQVGPGETVYYWVAATGQEGYRTWFEEYKGYYQTPQIITSFTGFPPGRPNRTDPRPPFVIIDTVPPTKRPIVYKPYTPPTPVFPRPEITSNITEPITMVEERPGPDPPPQRPFSRPDPVIDIRPQYPEPETIDVCRSTLTLYNGRASCAGKPVVERFQFESIEKIGGPEPEERFTVFSKGNVKRNFSQTLQALDALIPSLLVDKYGTRAIDRPLSLPDCTSKNREFCSYQPTAYLITPPILSARQTTERTLSFRYGILEVMAKLPQGDWIVPELWLLPKNSKYGERSGRIVLALSRGNSQLSDGIQDYGNRLLEAGVEFGDQKKMFQKVQNRPWSDDFHSFKLVWTPDQMVFSVDGSEIGRLRSDTDTLDPSLRGSKLAPFDQEFYLCFGVHVGGDKDFPESLKDKPWMNYSPKGKLSFWQARQRWQKSWGDSRGLYLYSISLTALDG